jgi:hypothetical protein
MSGVVRKEVNRLEIEQLQKILDSHLLRSAESLSRLLRFLAEHSLANPDEPLKEHQIATLGLGRRPDFDPTSDSTVRVQIGRLRSRLERYYIEFGQRDPVIIEIPRGAYSVVFTYRERSAAPTAVPEPAPMPAPVVVPPQTRNLPKVAAILAISAVCLCIASVLVDRSLASRTNVSPELRHFWSPFLDSPSAPLVIYPTRIGPASGPIDGVTRLPEEDAFTGVGEVMGAVELTRFFSAAGHPIRFRRFSIASWEDAKTTDLIFLGSASQAVQTLPPPQKFSIKRTSAPDQPKVTSIVNLHPEPGEPASFGTSPLEPCCRSIAVDYSLIILSKSVSPDRYALTLAGLTTIGTQAAVEFVCDPESLAGLRARLPGSRSGPVPQFEAVTKVTIRGGAPIRSELQAVYLRK